MTTVVYSNNCLYSDSRVTADTMIVSENAVKIHKLQPKGFKGTVLCGGAGSFEDMQAFLLWVACGMSQEDKPEITEFQGIVVEYVSKSKTQGYYFEPSLIPIPITDKYTSIGSGSPYALLAMDLGHGPVEAIKAASKRDTNTNAKVKIIGF